MNDLLISTKSRMIKEDYQKLVAVGIITDGIFRCKPCRNTQLIEFYSNDAILHFTFQDMMKRGFERNKTSYFIKDKCRGHGNLLVTGYELSQKDNIVTTLKELSPTYTTKWNSPSQPTINFLLNQKNELKELAVRFAMSCDGCVSVAHTKSGRVTPALKFACAHPTLVMEWKKLFENVGIKTWLDKDRLTWSGIHGLTVHTKENILKFKEIGGFYPKSVKVQRGNYKGLLKNQVLDGAYNWFENKEKDIDNLILNNGVGRI